MTIRLIQIVLFFGLLLLYGCFQQSKPTINIKSPIYSLNKDTNLSANFSKANDDSIYGIYYNNDNLPKNRRFGKNYKYNKCETEIYCIEINKNIIKMFSSIDSVSFKYKIYNKLNYKRFNKYGLLFDNHLELHSFLFHRNGILIIEPCDSDSKSQKFQKRL